MPRPRKNPLQTPKKIPVEIPETPPIEEETPPVIEETKADDEGLKIRFEKADDFEPSKKSFADEVKGFFKGFTQDDPGEKTGAKSAPRPHKTFENKSKLVAKGLIWVIGKTVPELNEKFILSDGEKETVCQLLPTDKQADNIVRPILRIVDRHTQVKGVNPDLVDLASAGAALVEYAWITHANLMLLRSIKEMELQANAQNHHKQSYTNGVESRGPETGVSTYQAESNIG